MAYRLLPGHCSLIAPVALVFPFLLWLLLPVPVQGMGLDSAVQPTVPGKPVAKTGGQGPHVAQCSRGGNTCMVCSLSGGHCLGALPAWFAAPGLLESGPIDTIIGSGRHNSCMLTAYNQHPLLLIPLLYLTLPFTYTYLYFL